MVPLRDDGDEPEAEDGYSAPSQRRETATPPLPAPPPPQRSPERLGTAQVEALRILALRADPLSAPQLNRAIAQAGRARPGEGRVREILKEFERWGWVTRRPDPQQRRTTSVYTLTDAGTLALAEVTARG